MSSTNTFIHASEALPCWTAARLADNGSCQLWPDQPKVIRAEQLPGHAAVGCGLNLQAPVYREAVSKPALEMLAGDANESGDAGLAATGEKSPVKGGFGFEHVKIIYKTTAKGKQADKQGDDPVMIQSSMDIWKRIDTELSRRRLNPMWLARKLNVTRQVINGWKTRGVPTRRYEEIAAALGWSLDRLVMGVEDVKPTPQPAPFRPPIQAELKLAQPVVAAVNQLATYSPLGLDLAAQFDAIPDDEQRLRAYALIMQIIRMSSAPQPTLPAQPQAGPVSQPMPAPHRAQ